MKMIMWLLAAMTSILFSGLTNPASAEAVIGLLQQEPEAFAGYTLFAPLSFTITYLIDLDGNQVHSWPSGYQPGNVARLLGDGTLLRAATVDNPVFGGGGAGGRIQRIAWDGSLVWDYGYSTVAHCQHHDALMLPGGNILFIAWEHKSAAAALAAGRNPALLEDGELWPDTVVEIEPSGATGGSVVWEWHVWDHLIQDYDPARANYGTVAGHPELVDVNYVSSPTNTDADWNHTNAIDYHAGFDQILLSLREFGEIWIIDHSTTTAEAAGHSGGNSGHGGDLLYRWGNPQIYGAGGAGDQMFFGQHNAQWIEESLPGGGNIMVFNNGAGRPGINYSSVEEIEPPVDDAGTYYLAPASAYGPSAPAWIYSAPVPSDFYSSYISGAVRLANGNTLICEGNSGSFFEITAGGGIVWRYVNPVTADGPQRQGAAVSGNTVFRCYRYGPDYDGLAGRDLTPQHAVELPEVKAPVAAGDYNGDGRDDPAVFRAEEGLWAARDVTRVYFGSSWDLPVSGDWDGDGTTESAVFRPSNGLWSARDVTRCYFGSSDDTAVPGDYDGDGTVEAGLFRESAGLWAIRAVTRAYLGSTGDRAAPGYYDADASEDIAVFRGSSGMWSVRDITRFYFGATDDDLAPGDYNGTGQGEAGIFRPSRGMWSIRNVTRIYLGSANDWALPADYNGDGRDEAGIFRDSVGLWSVRILTRVYFGSTNDIPVTR